MEDVFYTKEQISFLCEARERGLSWKDVCLLFNKTFDASASETALRKKYSRFKLDPDYVTKIATTSEKRKLRLKENNEVNATLLKHILVKDSLLEEIKKVVSKLKPLSLQKIKHKKSPEKKDMTLELLLSDIHYGKKTSTFNLKVCRARLQDLISTVIKEIDRNKKNYNVEKVIVALLGDIIESFSMHELESAAGCEFGDSFQVQAAIESLLKDVILPLSTLGIPLVLPCVTGNHDRVNPNRTMNDPGKNNVTWIIYNTLKLLCETLNLKHVEFIIPESPFALLKIYNNTVLYEHGDNTKNMNRSTLENFMNNRASQLREVIHFMRLGHYHEPTVLGRGKIIVNGSVPGQDSYSMIMGFRAEPVQILNYYINTDERPTCFYKSFPIYLK